MKTNLASSDNDPPIHLGVFYELPDGRIAFTYGASGNTKQVAYYFDDDSGPHNVSYQDFAAWKLRPDLSDFPNARDPLLPYEFDLWWDIKHVSQLKALLLQGHPDRADMLDLVVRYKVNI